MLLNILFLSKIVKKTYFVPLSLYFLIVHCYISIYKVYFVVFAVDAFAKSWASETFLKTLAVVLFAARFRAVTSSGMNFFSFFLYNFVFWLESQRILMGGLVLDQIYKIFIYSKVMTIQAVALKTTHSTIGEAITVKFQTFWLFAVAKFFRFNNFFHWSWVVVCLCLFKLILFLFCLNSLETQKRSKIIGNKIKGIFLVHLD